MLGPAILRAIQSISSPWLDTFWCGVTNLHAETFYLVALPTLLWVFDKRFARYLVSVFLLGLWANNVLKELFNTVRPVDGQNGVHRVALCENTGTGPAFPSGHAQNALMFWGAIALKVHRKWFTAFAVLLIFMIGFSRLYLGLHWPLDVIGGWAIGGALLFGFERTYGFWVGDGYTFRQRLLWGSIIPLSTLLVIPFLHGMVPKELYVFSGAYLGFWIGAVVEEEYVGFNPRAGNLLTQAAKIVIGLGMLFAIKQGVKLILPTTGIADFVRYALVGAGATFGAPWVFHHFFPSQNGAGQSIHPSHNL
jgi:membrane-associated phospholipid phosphatase